jgi:hypothetical protein
MADVITSEGRFMSLVNITDDQLATTWQGGDLIGITFSTSERERGMERAYV